MKNVIFTILSVGFLFLSCKKDKASAFVCNDVVSYSNEIRPLVEMNCSVSGCHDVSASGGYTFLTYQDVSSNAEKILESIQHGSGVSPMPQGANKLADSLIQKFFCWKDGGALDN